jgi:YidC/Oxa1 family membrane protein insertase
MAKKYQKVEFEEIKKKKADYEKQSSDGYVSMVQHYFASAWMLPEGVQRSISLRWCGHRLCSCRLLLPGNDDYAFGCDCPRR